MLRGYLALLVFVPVTVLCGLIATVLCLTGHPWGTMYMGRYWSRAMIWATNASIRFEDAERAVAHSPCIFLANHLSSLDIWALMLILPLETRFVAKQSLFRIPFIGWAMKSAGFIPVDRGDRQRSIESLTRAAQEIRAGSSVVLFAEGTRSRDGRLQPFKKGPFHLASQAQVPLVPILIEGSGKVIPPGTIRVHPGQTRVRFLAPFLPAEFRDCPPSQLRQEVYQAFVDAIEDPDARPVIDPTEGASR